MRRLSYLPRRFFAKIDGLTDKFTSYRLVYYVLLAIVGWAVVADALGWGSFPAKWYQIALSTAFLVIVCRAVNLGLGRFLNIATNKESDLITALILALIFAPAVNTNGYIILAGAGAIAIASKFLIAWRRAHIFNPAAVGAFVMGLVFHKYASWWVGTSILTPVVFIGGWLILRKMKRFILVSLFLAVSLVIVLIYAWNGSAAHAGHILWLDLVDTQLLFFAYIMLIEPQTSPTDLSRYLPYGLIVAVYFGSIYLFSGHPSYIFSPEEALLIGNVLTVLIAFNPRYKLKLLKKVDEAAGIKSFVFERPKDLKFKAGQYMEWGLPASRSDSRGNRRYFTISSSPTEENMMVTLRFPEKTSSYKKALDGAPHGFEVLAARLAGSFTLPENKEQKLAFLAGGVGITPFRSVAKYLADSDEQRDAKLLYGVNSAAEIAFKDIFKQAKKAGLEVSYVVSEPSHDWAGPRGHIDENIIKKAIPDYKQRKFYVSGPLPFVSAMEQVLAKLGVSSKNIKTDYFPGYA